ncbi:MAG: hypothetical protein Q8M03_16810 [Legionella sp.]|nr:hypothetical protein [Legionella sp.]
MKILEREENLYGAIYIRLQLSDPKDIGFFNKSNLLHNLLTLPKKFHSIVRSEPPAVLRRDNEEISIKSTIGGGYGFYSNPYITAEEFLTYLHSHGLISSNPFNSDNITTCSNEEDLTATPFYI